MFKSLTFTLLIALLAALVPTLRAAQSVGVTFIPTDVTRDAGTVMVNADLTSGVNNIKASGTGIAGGNTGGTGPVVRQVAASYQPGVKLPVQLAVTPASGTIAYAVEEHPPLGWTVADITQSGTADTVTGTVKWGPFFDNQPRSLEYSLVPPSTASGTARFSGVGSFDGSDVNIVGIAEITATVVVANKPPTVTLTSPATSQKATAPASFAIEATAADVDGRVVKVEFFQGSTKVGEATATPFKATWAGVAAGDYQIFARATDDKGATTDSSPVAVNVSAPTTSGSRKIVIRDVSTSAGTAVQIPIELVGLGTENTVSFSLRFDPAILTFTSLTVSPSLTGTQNIPNTSAVANGSLGLILALSPGQVFASGTNLLATLLFQVATSVQGGTTSEIAFVDQPVFREIVSAEADTLPTEFVLGKVVISAGFEADLAPRPNGDGRVSAADWTLIGRIVAGLAGVSNGPEFQRTDCAPRSTSGDGRLTSADWTQAGRYAAGVDAVKPAGGPSAAAAPASLAEGGADAVPRLAKTALSGRQVRLVSEGINSDSTVVVGVEIVALGNENTLGFSLGFDPKALVFQNVVLADTSSSAQLLPNTAAVDAGKLGILLGYPSGQSIPAGARRLLSITFQIRTDAVLPSTLSFGDAPVFREVVSSDVDILESGWVDGIIQALVGSPDFLAPRLWERSTASSFDSGPARSESDGKGGVFLSFGTDDWMDGQQVGAPIKLRESDGSIDPTFKPGIQGFFVAATAAASDGKVLVAQYRDNCHSVERLLPNGQRDETFIPIAFSQSIRYLTLAPNGDILVTVFGGVYSTPHPKAVLTPTPTVVRLKPNGVQDTTFKVPEIGGANPYLFAPPVMDPQGRIYIGGAFTIGTTDKRVNIARLQPNGALDLTFLGSASLTSPMTGTIRGIGFQKDGKIVAVGDIRLPERVTAMRFDVDGRRDLSFTSVLRTAIGASDYPRMLVVQPDDKIVCASGGLVRLNADGTLDGTFKRFAIPGGFLSWVSSLSDGRLLLPGVVLDGPNAFLADGTPDPSFKPHHFGVTQTPTSLAFLPSGQSVIAGGFNRMDGQLRTGIAILDNMGRADAAQPVLSGLYPGFTEDAFYTSLFGSPLVAEADNGAFYFAGNLSNTNQEPVFNSIARLNGSTQDPTFQPTLADVTSSDQIESSTDGDLWVVHNGAQAALEGKWLTRLLASGQRAPTFGGLPASVLAELGEVIRLSDRSISQIKAGTLRILHVLPDGGLLASLNTIHGTARIIRLDSSGQLVGSFQSPQVAGLVGASTFSDVNDPPSGSAQAQGLSFQEAIFLGASPLPDGRWVICGNFSELSGKQTPGVALLQSNGSFDESFVPPSTTYDIHPFTTARMLSVETDTQGRIYIAGLFNKLAGEPAPGLVRLHPSGAWDRSFVSPVELTDYPIPSAQLRIKGDHLFALGTFRDPSESFPRPLWRISLASDDMELAARVGPNGRIHLVLAITSGRPLTSADSPAMGFETSTDLKIWNPVPGTVTLENGILRFDPSSGGGEASRFYRSVRR